MWRKLFIACVILVGTVSIGYTYAHQLSAVAATDITKLKSGYNVILGPDPSGQEVVWDVHVENNDNYTLSTKIDHVQYCTDSTNNFVSTSSPTTTPVAYCDFISTASGKDNSPVYTSAKAFDDAFYISNQANSFEQSEIIDQSSTSNGNLMRAIIPSPAQLTSGGILGITDRTQLLGKELTKFALSDRVYDATAAKDYGVGVSRSFFRYGYSGPGGQAYSQWVEFEWARNYGNNPTTDGWQMVDVRPFLQTKKAKIVSVLNHDYHKDTLYEIAQQDNIFKIRYTDPGYTISFNDIKANNVSIVGKKVVKDTTLQLDAVASDTLTVFVYNNTGSDLLYYTNGSHKVFVKVPCG